MWKNLSDTELEAAFLLDSFIEVNGTMNTTKRNTDLWPICKYETWSNKNDQTDEIKPLFNSDTNDMSNLPLSEIRLKAQFTR